jgi:DNA polymerase III delta subunit
MLILLLGPDNFSKKDHISFLAAQEKAEVEFFVDETAPPRLENLLEQDLFAKKKLHVLQGLLAKYSLDSAVLEKLINSKNTIIFLEDKVDKRLASNKLVLANKNVKVKDFTLPHGSELDAWIIKQVKAAGASISKPAANLLAQKLGRDDVQETKFGGKVVDVKEVYNLHQAQSEINKLIAYAAGREITPQDVEDLVVEDREVDVLKIVNAIGDRQKGAAFNLVNEFLRDGDNKAQVIQLNALLSEQFRNILVVQDFTARNVPEAGILEQTSWKSGRLFVMKKISRAFVPAKVKDCLNKLAALDGELKTSSTPPRVLLDLILTQLFV